MEEGANTNEAEGIESGRSPESWGRQLRRGDAQALREARKRVSRILSHGPLSIPPEERDDLEQEIMTEIWQALNRPGFDFSRGFWGFVEVVTSRRCIDWLRGRKENIPLPEDLTTPGPGPLRRLMGRERSELASEILAALDPRCRKLIVLRLRDALSYSEIGKIVGKSEGALRIQFYRCIGKARKLLSGSERLTNSSMNTEDRP